MDLFFFIVLFGKLIFFRNLEPKSNRLTTLDYTSRCLGSTKQNRLTESLHLLHGLVLRPGCCQKGMQHGFC